MAQPPAAETTYYDEGGVKITSARAVLGGTTYPLSNISSVGIAQQSPNILVPLFVFGLGVLSGILGLLGLVTNVWVGISGFVFAAIFMALAVLIFVVMRPRYFVRIASTGGERDALSSPDRPQVEKIVASLNEAIVRRG